MSTNKTLARMIGDATTAGRDLLTAASAAAQRTLLELGDLATKDAVNNGDWTGTDLAIGNGGTGASTAANARTNLDVPGLSIANTFATQQTFQRANPAGIVVERTDGSVNANIQYKGTGGSIWAGLGSSDTFAVGGTSGNLTSSPWLSVSSTAMAFSGTLNATTLQENGTNLESKYARLGSANTYTAANTYNTTVNIGAFSADGTTDGKKFESAAQVLQSSRDGVTAQHHVQWYNGNGQVGRVETESGSTSYVTSSDARLKSFDAPSLSPGAVIDDIAALLAPYTWKGSGNAAYGVSAQALYEVAPFAVARGGDDPKAEPWGIDEGKLMWHLIAYVKLLEQRVAALESS